jgi:hypothetical protein
MLLKKKLLVFVDQHFHQRLVFEELDMGSTANESVEAFLGDFEIDVDSVEAVSA